MSQAISTKPKKQSQMNMGDRQARIAAREKQQPRLLQRKKARQAKEKVKSQPETEQATEASTVLP